MEKNKSLKGWIIVAFIAALGCRSVQSVDASDGRKSMVDTEEVRPKLTKEQGLMKKKKPRFTTDQRRAFFVIVIAASVYFTFKK